jgi:hypothetical protein
MPADLALNIHAVECTSARPHLQVASARRHDPNASVQNRAVRPGPWRPGPALRSPRSRSEALDAALIAAQQAVEHDEITRVAP